MKRGGRVKKIIIAFSLFGVSAVLYAANGAAYMGMQLGANTGGSWSLTNPAGSKTSFGMTGESLGILAGYGKSFGEKWYLSGEGFVSDSVTRTSNKNTDATGTTVKMRTTYSYGVSILPGYHIGSDTMLFARLGVIQTHFELTQALAAQSFSQTAGKLVTGGQVGVGLALGLSKTLALRGEYVYSAYQSFKAYGNKVSPRNNQLLVSFTYKFV
jgi:hypothetical protein